MTNIRNAANPRYSCHYCGCEILTDNKYCSEKCRLKAEDLLKTSPWGCPYCNPDNPKYEDEYLCPTCRRSSY